MQEFSSTAERREQDVYGSEVMQEFSFTAARISRLDGDPYDRKYEGFSLVQSQRDMRVV